MSKLSEPTLAKLERDQETSFDAEAYEQQNVHAVYQEIASHFSHTRYKPWPLIPAFLSTLPSGSIGIDLGCGNGKYLHLRSTLAPSFLHPSEVQDSCPQTTNISMNLLTIGADRSSNLIDLALQNYPEPKTFGPGPGISWNPSIMKERNEVAVADALQSGFRSRAFDYAISIATIHHFSTHERRRKAAEELIRLVRPIPRSLVAELAAKEDSNPTSDSVTSDPSTLRSGYGRVMIYAWALEQRGETRRTWDEKKKQENEKAPTSASTTTQPETSFTSSEAGSSKAENPSHSNQENTEVRNKDHQNGSGSQDKARQDVLVPWVIPTHLVKGESRKKKQENAVRRKVKGDGKKKTQAEFEKEKMEEERIKQEEAKIEEERRKLEEEKMTADSLQKSEQPVFQRYYHVFRSGELEELVEEAASEIFKEHSKSFTVQRQAGGWEKGNWWGIWQVIEEGE